MGVDDRGDRDGRPVLFFHGTPDTRLARHPDDGIAASLAVRLVAADRPGLGGSDVDPDASPTTVADDHAHVLDHLGIERTAVLAWSAGTIPALAFAGRHPDRVERLTLVAPLVPADAYTGGGADALDGAGEDRRLFAEVMAATTPEEAGRELAMWLVPPEVEEETARMLIADSLREISHVDGAAEVLVAALLGSVERGMTGLEREIAAQATPLSGLLDDVRSDGVVHVGAQDTRTPPAMAHWIGTRIGLPVVVHPSQSHLLAITRWRELLAEAAGDQPSPGGVVPGSGASGSCHGTEGTSDHSRSSS